MGWEYWSTQLFFKDWTESGILWNGRISSGSTARILISTWSFHLGSSCWRLKLDKLVKSQFFRFNVIPRKRHRGSSPAWRIEELLRDRQTWMSNKWYKIDHQNFFCKINKWRGPENKISSLKSLREEKDSKQTKSIAVVVSESSVVRIFDRGEIVTEILPELWLLNRHGIHINAPFTTQKTESIAVACVKEWCWFLNIAWKLLFFNLNLVCGRNSYSDHNY